MKINENGRINPLQSYQKNGPPRKAADVTARGTSRDEVSISPEALEMAQGGLSQAESQQRTAHTENLEQIRQSVQNGTYQVDVRKVAEKLARYLLGE